MAAGCSVVLKPAEQSPSSAIRIAELACEAGIPPGVLNVVTGLGETAGRALGLHPDVDCIAFTGSTEVGRLFLSYAGQSNGKQVWLECGGKSAHVVFGDADLEAAAANTAMGIWFNQGAVCSAHSRLLVERSVHAEMVERLVAEAARFQPGDPLDPASGMGAIVSAEQTDRIMGFLSRMGAAGQIRVGGSQVTLGQSSCFVEPTVVDLVDPTSELGREEIFGPVLCVVPFDDEDEAISLANDSAYGLAASVATTDLGRAHRVADRLHAGTVTVNGVDAFSAQTPFGGFKASGFGRDLSLHAMDKYVGLKTTWINY